MGAVPLESGSDRPTQQEEVPWSSAFETLEQQQDSCSSHAKTAARKNASRCLRNALKSYSRPSKHVGNRCEKGLETSMRAVPLAKRFRQAHSRKKSHGVAPSKHSNSSRIRAQVMRNSSQKKCLTLLTERSKKRQ